MDMEMKTQVSIDFTSDEYRLVGLALCGQLKDRDDVAKAAELNVRTQAAAAHDYKIRLVAAERALGRAVGQAKQSSQEDVRGDQ